MSATEPSTQNYNLVVIAIAATVIGLPAALWYAGRPVVPEAPKSVNIQNHVERVNYTQVTQHDSQGKWVTTRSFPKDAVERLASQGYRIVSVDETAGVVTLSK